MIGVEAISCATSAFLVSAILAIAFSIDSFLRWNGSSKIEQDRISQLIDDNLLQSLSTKADHLVDRSASLAPFRARYQAKSSDPGRNPLLPNELCDAIVYEARHHKPTLLACSLVCSQWLPMSRRCLTVDVLTSPHVRSLGNIIRSPHETISSHIYHIHLNNLRGILDQHRRVLRMLQRKEARIQIATISSWKFVKLLGKYHPDIRELRLVSHPVPQVGPDVFRRWFQERCYKFLESLWKLRDMKALSIDLAAMEDISVPSLEEVTEMPLLSSLALKGSWNSDVASCLARCCVSLTSLELTAEKSINTTIVHKFLRENRETLQHLKISVLENGPYDLSVLQGIMVVHVVLSGCRSEPAVVATLGSLVTCGGKLHIVIVETRDRREYPEICKAVTQLGVSHTEMSIGLGTRSLYTMQR